MGTLMSGDVEGMLRGQTGAGRLDGEMEAVGEKNAPLTLCFGTVELLWG